MLRQRKRELRRAPALRALADLQALAAPEAPELAGPALVPEQERAPGQVRAPREQALAPPLVPAQQREQVQRRLALALRQALLQQRVLRAPLPGSALQRRWPRALRRWPWLR